MHQVKAGSKLGETVCCLVFYRSAQIDSTLFSGGGDSAGQPSKITPYIFMETPGRPNGCHTRERPKLCRGHRRLCAELQRGYPLCVVGGLLWPQPLRASLASDRRWQLLCICEAHRGRHYGTIDISVSVTYCCSALVARCGEVNTLVS